MSELTAVELMKLFVKVKEENTSLNLKMAVNNHTISELEGFLAEKDIKIDGMDLRCAELEGAFITVKASIRSAISGVYMRISNRLVVGTLEGALSVIEGSELDAINLGEIVDNNTE